MSKTEKQKFYFKEFREKIGMTQKEILDKLEIQQSTLAKYEALSISPSIDFLKKYCTTLNANPNFILYGQEPHLRTNVIEESEYDVPTMGIVKEALDLAIETGNINKLRIALLGYMEENK